MDHEIVRFAANPPFSAIPQHENFDTTSVHHILLFVALSTPDFF